MRKSLSFTHIKVLVILVTLLSLVHIVISYLPCNVGSFRSNLQKQSWIFKSRGYCFSCPSIGTWIPFFKVTLFVLFAVFAPLGDSIIIGSQYVTNFDTYPSFSQNLITQGTSFLMKVNASDVSRIEWAAQDSINSNTDSASQIMAIDSIFTSDQSTFFTAGFCIRECNLPSTNGISPQLVSSRPGLSFGFLAKYAQNGSISNSLVFNDFSDAGAHSLLYAVKADATLGAVYVAGTFKTKLSVGSTTLTTSNTGTSCFIAKTDLNLNLQWVYSISDSATCTATSLAVDPLDHGLYVAGEFTGTMVNMGGLAVSSQGGYDGFILKYNTSTLLTANTATWVSLFSGKGADRVNALSVTSTGNVIAVGYMDTSGSVTGPLNTLQFTGSYSLDALVASISTNGTVQWVSSITSQHIDFAQAVSIDSNDFIYVTGAFSRSATVNNYYSLVSKGSRDVFIAKLKSESGIIMWVDSIGSPSTDFGSSILATDSNLFVAANVKGPFDFIDGKQQTSPTLPDTFTVLLNYKSACVGCPLGYYSNVYNASGISDCSICPSGSYSDSLGSTSCSTCTLGTVASKPGSSSVSNCRICDKGRYSSIYPTTTLFIGEEGCKITPPVLASDSVGNFYTEFKFVPKTNTNLFNYPVSSSAKGITDYFVILSGAGELIQVVNWGLNSNSIKAALFDRSDYLINVERDVLLTVQRLNLKTTPNPYLAYTYVHDTLSNNVEAIDVTSTTSINSPLYNHIVLSAESLFQNKYVLILSPLGQNVSKFDIIRPPSQNNIPSITGIGTDLAGNVIIVGNFISSVSFVNSSEAPLSTSAISSASSSVAYEMFLVKYSANNYLYQFSTKLGAGIDDYVKQSLYAKVTGSNTVIVVGSFYNDIYCGENTFYRSQGDSDGFIASFSTDTGACLWMNTIGGFGDDNVVRIALDQEGNIYAVGHFQTAASAGSFSLLQTKVQQKMFSFGN